MQKAISDDAEDYVFRKLAPGNYCVATQLRKPGAPPPKRNQDVDGFLIYAPSTFTLSDAKVIHLGIGDDTAESIELRLRPFVSFHLEGRAQMETVGQAVSGKLNLYLDPRDQNGVTAPGRELELQADGKFEADVLPESYTLRLVGVKIPDATRKSKAPEPMLLHLLAKQPIEISGKDTYGIVVLISPAFTIDGHVSVEGQPNEPINGGEIKLEGVDPIAPASTLAAKIQADGSFAIPNADSVTYAVRYSPPPGMYVKSIEFNGQDALSHYLELSSGGAGGMKIVLKPGEGSVTVSEGPGSISSDVILIPDDWSDSNLTPVIHLDPNGNALVPNGLPPGGYAAVTTFRLDRQTWADDAFVREMRARGTSFLLHENEQKAVSAPEVSREEISRI